MVEVCVLVGVWDVHNGPRGSHHTGDADAQYSVCFRVDEQLRDAIVGILGRGAPRSSPREARDLYSAADFLGFFFRQAAPGNFRVGVDDAGNGVGFESCFVAGDYFGGYGALV